MAKKRKITTKSKAASVKLSGRSAASRRRSSVATRSFSRFVLPLIIFCVLAGGLVFLGLSGYRTATASGFFGLRNVEIHGNERTSADDIRRIIAASVEKPGVWKADLSDIRTKVEKFPFVKSAAVSMILPAGIRVNLTERIPAAVVHLNSGNFLVDNEGTILAIATASDQNFPFVLRGWDETKTEKAIPDNLARLKLYKKMLDEWEQFDLASRVKEVNLANPREPVAVVEDSGHSIAVTLAKDNLGKSLQRAIEALSGKGAKVKSVDAEGIYPVIQYLEF
ncbi:MAG: FtsQ-type POTRA domain-containing protein [Pyrinomonadaceae bacterium]